MIRERDIIRRLREAFPDSGLGDDAAVLEFGGEALLMASDAAVEGVHFNLSYSTLGQAVQKAITSNVSDIYAMGGTPVTILLSAGLRPGLEESDIEGMIDGLKKGCWKYRLELAGGDTVLSPGGCFFDIAIAGSLRQGKALTRTGAREGDTIVVSGELGGSLAGLRLLNRLSGPGGGEDPLDALIPGGEDERRAVLEAVSTLSLLSGEEEIGRICRKAGIGAGFSDALGLVARHLVPVAAEAAGPDSTGLSSFRSSVNAMIDISDGLAGDLRTLCAESGKGALVEASRIPVPSALRGLGAETALELALSSGEEYSILMSVDRHFDGELPPGASVIGRVTGRGSGVVLVGGDGSRRELREEGYEHKF